LSIVVLKLEKMMQEEKIEVAEANAGKQSGILEV